MVIRGASQFRDAITVAAVLVPVGMCWIHFENSVEAQAFPTFRSVMSARSGGPATGLASIMVDNQ